MKRWGGWLIPIFVAMVPWDISKVLFPPYQSAPETPTTLTFARIAMVILLVWGAARLIQLGLFKTLKRLWQAPLLWAVVPLFLAVAISYSGSLQPAVTLQEGARLLILCALGLSVAVGAERSLTFNRVWQAIFMMATITALFGLVQYLTGNWIWGGGINTAGVRRVNSTFIDPNIFARYLDISILGTFVLLIRREWRPQPYIILGLSVQVLALGATFSRTGWLILMLGIILLAFLSARRMRFWILGTGGLLTGILFLMPIFRTRLLATGGGMSVLGQREHLIKGGWAMFIEHPLRGVGLGNFQWALENPYRYIVPWSDAVTRSHTSLVTVAAEMGFFGVAAMLIFLAFTTLMNLRIMGRMQAFAQATIAGIFVIWLSSQGEGRFFEDPLVWVFWGLSLALQWKHWGEDWDA